MVGCRIVAKVTSAGCDGHTGAVRVGQRHVSRSTACRFGSGSSRTRSVVVDALAPYQDLIGARDRHDRRPPDRGGHCGHRPDRPARQQPDRTAAHAPLPADPPGPPRPRARQRRLAISLGVSPGDGAATVDVEPDPDGRVQLLGRAVRPAPAGRPATSDVPVAGSTTPCGGRCSPMARRCTSSTTASTCRRSNVADLEGALKAPRRHRVVLDIRHNFGGERPALDAMVAPFGDPAVEPAGPAVRAHRPEHVLGRQHARGPAGARTRGDARRRADRRLPDDLERLVGRAAAVVRDRVSVAGDVAVGVDAERPARHGRARGSVRSSRGGVGGGIDPALELFDVEAP